MKSSTTPARPSSRPPRYRRTAFSSEQTRVLEEWYEQNPMPSRMELETLEERLSLPLKHVRIWFQNRRQRRLGSQRGNEVSSSSPFPHSHTRTLSTTTPFDRDLAIRIVAISYLDAFPDADDDDICDRVFGLQDDAKLARLADGAWRAAVAKHARECPAWQARDLQACYRYGWATASIDFGGITHSDVF